MDIRNGYLTGRKVGDSGPNLGLEVLNGTDQGGNRFNYVLHTRDGKIFRSSSVYFHNDEGKVIGSLCVNLDITETIRFEEYLKGYNQYDLGDAGNTSSEEAKEIFVNDVTPSNTTNITETKTVNGFLTLNFESIIISYYWHIKLILTLQHNNFKEVTNL